MESNYPPGVERFNPPWEHEVYSDTWIINGKEYTFEDRQHLYKEFIRRGMINEPLEVAIDEVPYSPGSSESVNSRDRALESGD